MIIVGILGVLVVVIAGVALVLGNTIIDKFAHKTDLEKDGHTSTYYVGSTKYVKLNTAEEQKEDI